LYNDCHPRLNGLAGPRRTWQNTRQEAPENRAPVLKQQGIPVVVVLLSGRPMIIDQVLDQADAFLAAWLPGTEGQGVTDVLFGDYRLTGKLSHSWPRSMSQIPINVGDSNDSPLFKYGVGLTY
jgi:beta-glucosidase